jgi:hypothetical protein
MHPFNALVSIETLIILEEDLPSRAEKLMGYALPK